MYTREEIYYHLSSLQDENIRFTNHFLKRLQIRNKIGVTVLNDPEEIKKILLNRCPVYVECEEKDEYKVYYDVSDTQDLIIVLWLRVSSPVKIRLLTLYPQKVNRRLNKNGRTL